MGPSSVCGRFGLLLTGSAGSFVQQLGDSSDFERLLGTLFPGIDMGTVGGFLQLLFLEFGFVLAGLAAATLVAGWASDETSGRLELLLATPLARARWVVVGGLGIFATIGVFVGLAILGIAVGAASAGGDVVSPVLGTLVLGVFAMAMAGVGIAVGGLVRSGIAGPVVAIVTIATWFVDIIGPALNLPDVVQDLALTALRPPDGGPVGRGRDRGIAGHRDRRSRDRGLGLRAARPQRVVG